MGSHYFYLSANKDWETHEMEGDLSPYSSKEKKKTQRKNFCQRWLHSPLVIGETL